MTVPAYQWNPSSQPAENDNRFVFHLEMKHGQPECAFECNEYSVRRAATLHEYKNTANLVQNMYSRKGYLTEGVSSLPRRDNTITLDAHDSEQVMGTLTLRVDAKETGLLADTLYADEINEFRNNGRKVCEVSKLAVDPRYGSKELMASLFQLAYLYLHIVYRASDAFIEVNPRHAGFYKRMLGFHEIGELKTCPRVNAPAVLLHIELAYMRRQIALHSGRNGRGGDRSLYSYFLSCSAEDWIDRAMRAKPGNSH
jgi:hypothetical protein